MKIYIAGSDELLLNKGGKGLFMGRLADSLRTNGETVTADKNERSDVAVHLARIDKTVNASKHVVRIDGVYHNTLQGWQRKNRTIREGIEQADGVVYQSQHSKRLTETFVGAPTCPTAVVLNGSSVAYYDACKTAETEDARFDGTYTCTVHAKWRGHKRLGPMIEAFLQADLPSSVLHVAGNLSKCCVEQHKLKSLLDEPRVTYLGVLNQRELARQLLMSDVAMHLCWLDACPNSVCEALCAGLPVLTNNVGGSHELLELAGLHECVCEIDEPWDYEPCRLYEPPVVNLDVVADKLWSVFLDRPKVDPTPVDMHRPTSQYLEFLNGLL